MVAHSVPVASVVQVSLLSGTKVQNEKRGGVPPKTLYCWLPVLGSKVHPRPPRRVFPSSDQVFKSANSAHLKNTYYILHLTRNDLALRSSAIRRVL